MKGLLRSELALQFLEFKGAAAGSPGSEGDQPHCYPFTAFAVGTDRLPVTTEPSAAVIGFQLHFDGFTSGAAVSAVRRGVGRADQSLLVISLKAPRASLYAPQAS
jgi:hypothetical protein